ncbi:hypothetical protein E2C01_093794 [Portunus trituberculatus]|uniref:Uncharacterized protein n=1 Tax=Portunus trituberculatus TaxID=210409 RepID=A0A5B7JVF1_PORTR|nr:hypothetical protein [Portunus trituberculatus]
MRVRGHVEMVTGDTHGNATFYSYLLMVYLRHYFSEPICSFASVGESIPGIPITTRLTLKLRRLEEFRV